jgi:hypothetical protein
MKVGNEIEALKKQIDDLKGALSASQQKQADAKGLCKKLEKDMNEFKNNKDGKIGELKVRTVPWLRSSMICTLTAAFVSTERNFPAKDNAPEAVREGENAAEGNADCHTRTG